MTQQRGAIPLEDLDRELTPRTLRELAQTRRWALDDIAEFCDCETGDVRQAMTARGIEWEDRTAPGQPSGEMGQLLWNKDPEDVPPGDGEARS